MIERTLTPLTRAETADERRKINNLFGGCFGRATSRSLEKKSGQPQFCQWYQRVSASSVIISTFQSSDAAIAV
jgi:hypothetical protein